MNDVEKSRFDRFRDSFSAEEEDIATWFATGGNIVMLAIYAAIIIAIVVTMVVNL